MFACRINVNASFVYFFCCIPVLKKKYLPLCVLICCFNFNIQRFSNGNHFTLFINTKFAFFFKQKYSCSIDNVTLLCLFNCGLNNNQ